MISFRVVLEDVIFPAPIPVLSHSLVAVLLWFVIQMLVPSEPYFSDARGVTFYSTALSLLLPFWKINPLDKQPAC